jgi:predicted GIY-YIG superfamily endonuclease
MTAATATAGTIYLIHFDQPYKHARHYIGWAIDVVKRLAEHAAGRGAHLMAVIKDAGITWQLARTWPGDRRRERALKNMGGARRRCPLCGVHPQARPAAELPRNRDGSLSRSRTTDREKLLAGVMTSAQLAAHTALRHGTVAGKPPRPAERGPVPVDLWLDAPAGSLAHAGHRARNTSSLGLAS